MTAPSDASRRPRDAGLFTVMRRAGPRNVSVPSAQSRYARVPTNSQSRSLIRNRRVLYQLLCAVSPISTNLFFATIVVSIAMFLSKP